MANRGRVPSFYGYRAWDQEFSVELNTPKNLLYKPKGVPRSRESPATFTRVDEASSARHRDK